jgi:hypothetical protein
MVLEAEQDGEKSREGGFHIAQFPQKRIQCDLKILSGEKVISQRKGRELTPARRESLQNQLVRMDP